MFVSHEHDEGLLKTIEAGFLDALKRLAQSAPTEFEFVPTIPDDAPTPKEVALPEVPIHRRIDEEARLRRADASEESCVRGPECEGTRIVNGFTLIRYDEHDLRCLLCQRYDAFLTHYKSRLNGQSPAPFPWRNLVDVPGEYTSRACICPSVGDQHDPFVLHLRHQYRCNGDFIEQHGVNFRGPPTEGGTALGIPTESRR